MRIMIVDDDALIRDGLRMILESEKGFEIAGIASNGQEAVKLCAEVMPDVVLMDIRMPVMDGVLAVKLIKEQFRNVRILMLTTFKDSEYIRGAIKNGAEGYILKSNSTESIINSIQAVYKGNLVFDKEVAEFISGVMDRETKLTRKELDVTQKEYEIMELVSRGFSNKEIADKLFMSEGTVRNNISVILDKLSLRDRTQLAIFFIRNLED